MGKKSKPKRKRNVKEEYNMRQTQNNYQAEYLHNYGKPTSYSQRQNHVPGVSDNFFYVEAIQILT